MVIVRLKRMVLLLWLVVTGPVIALERVVMDFSVASVDDFEQQSFAGHTDYQTVVISGSGVLQATTHRAASALFRKIEIDLTRTPFLSWRWRVENTYSIANQQVKAGDDYPARVYVVFKRGIFPWQTRALNYIWSNTEPDLPYWANPFTAKAMMIPLRSPADGVGRWYNERVNVAEDYYRVFGERIETIHGVALMTDGDNSGSSAVAYYGNILFSD